MYTFNYHKPDSLAKAKDIFSSCDDPLYLAGGHTLLPSMKQRLRDPSDLIDLSCIEDLKTIAVDKTEVKIGALVTHDTVSRSNDIAKAIPALCHLAGGIGDAQVRNRGTIGGSLANNDPSADYPAAALGLGASIVTDGREIVADDFFVDMFETSLNDGELITEVRFPVPDAAAYVKFPNPASRYATVGVWVARFGKDVRVAITGAAPSVFRATDMEKALSADFKPGALDGITLNADGMNTDLHASGEYRAHLCVVLAKRAVAELT
ncbi:MAG TPA: xanthine dehydrogenase family protein subunit M [Pseudomonadales bacterium]|nr:xanthine dehydrogenase family protein subunit M [Pseudomonadales bacterium]